MIVDRRPRLLDLYGGEGGAAMGYARAGWDVIGVDIKPQPRYPFRFIRADATQLDPEWIARRFDAVHASPPCQHYSAIRVLNPDHEYPDLVQHTRDQLGATGLHYVIENVPGAPLVDPIQLCGSSFGLRLERHRLFECTFPIQGIRCQHGWQSKIFQVWGSLSSRRPKAKDGFRATHRSGVVGVFGGGSTKGNHRELSRIAMDVDWMSNKGLNQAIPPVYTQYIGSVLWGFVVQEPRIRYARRMWLEEGRSTGMF